MRLFLDCEFNGFGGQLISMALVPEDITLVPFYEELHITETIDPWVEQHVIPILDGNPIDNMLFRAKLRNYLNQFPTIYITADWPDDIKHLCQSLITGPGLALKLNSPQLICELDFSISYNSKKPHHALHDAIAIRQSILERENNAD